MNNVLHLDGIISFTGALTRYGWDSPGVSQETLPKNKKIFHGEVCCRIFALAQALLALAISTAKQAIRATCCLIGGVGTGNKKLIAFALKDLGGILVQMVALPQLGIFATISPPHALQAANKIVHALNPLRHMVTSAPHDVFLSAYHVSQDIKYHSRLMEALIRFTAPIQAILMIIQGLGEILMSGKPDKKLLIEGFPATLSWPIFVLGKHTDKVPSATYVHGFAYIRMN